jgi:hypothetical protein
MLVASSNVVIRIAEGASRGFRTGDKGHKCALAFTSAYEGQTIALAAQRIFEPSHPSLLSRTNISLHLPIQEMMSFKGGLCLLLI